MFFYKSVLVGYNTVSTVIQEDGYNLSISQIFPLCKIFFALTKQPPGRAAVGEVLKFS